MILALGHVQVARGRLHRARPILKTKRTVLYLKIALCNRAQDNNRKRLILTRYS